MSGRYISNQEIIDNIQTVINDLGYVPYLQQYLNHSLCRVSKNTVSRRFGRFDKLIESMGYKPSYVSRRIYQREDVIENTRKIVDKLGRAPSLEEIIKDPDYGMSGTTVHTFFKSIKDLYKAIGIEYKSTVGRPVKGRTRKGKRDLIINDLRDAYYSHKFENPSLRDIEKLSGHSYETIHKYVGDSDIVKEAIGFDKDVRYYRSHPVNKLDVIQDMYRLIDEHEDFEDNVTRILTEYGKYNFDTYTKHIGNIYAKKSFIKTYRENQKYRKRYPKRESS